MMSTESANPVSFTSNRTSILAVVANQLTCTELSRLRELHRPFPSRLITACDKRASLTCRRWGRPSVPVSPAFPLAISNALIQREVPLVQSHRANVVDYLKQVLTA